MDGVGPRGLRRPTVRAGGKAFAKVGGNNSSADDALEAGFFRGLSLLFSGDYPHARRPLQAWPACCPWLRF